MKTITMYELLGLVKDGKAPKKVKWKNNIYTYVYDDDREENIINYYYSEEQHCHLIDGRQHDIRLNDEVEIIEEEKKIPETLIPTSLKGIDNLDEKIEIAHTDTISVIDTVNEIIDYLKNKGDE